MKLNELLRDVPVVARIGESDPEIAHIRFDSRAVQTGDLFVAISGTQVDGHQFIDKAISQGASAIVLEKQIENVPDLLPLIQVENSRKALALLAANYYGRPAEKLAVTGVTGTNGKTSVVTLLWELFTRMGLPSGQISTIGNMVVDQPSPATHTTPDPLQVQELLARMVDQGCGHVFMEVSSHALDQDRVAGIDFAQAIFTNLTRDHLDYHGTFKAYLTAKKRLFDGLSSQAVAITNTDDKNGKVMVQNTAAEVRTYGLRGMCDYRGRILENAIEGLHMQVADKEAWFGLRGRFNAYNLLAVFAAAVESGLEAEEVLQTMTALKGVPGRFEVLGHEKSQVRAVVDYAHTPDALRNVLETLAGMLKGEGHIITVMGCGGNRDKGKRPVMGRIAAGLSDQLVVTSDNPRDEAPQTIIDDVLAGIDRLHRRKVLSIVDRREAIRTAIRLANPGDVVLVAGKGHETYQEIAGVRHPFDDREEVAKALNELE